MARELETHVRCDLCPRSATQHEVPIRVGTAVRTAKLDLCEEHYQSLIQPVLDALAAARPYASSGNHSRRWAGRDVGPYLCLEACVSTPLKNLTTFTQHLRGIHGMTIGEYESRHGKPVPLTPEEVADITVEAKCPVDECGVTYSTALGNRWPQQALRGHMWGVHAIRWSPADV